MYMKMKYVSGLGLGLSLVFGCLLLALIAELYYLLWWKKKRIVISKIDENGSQISPKTISHFFYIFCCWKNPTSSPSLSSTAQELCSSPTLVHEPQTQPPSTETNKDLYLKPFGEDSMTGSFPRFLSTITEETGEDLESEDGIFKNSKQSTSRSNLSDLIQILETPFLTPPASPPYFTPPLTPSFREYHQQDISPVFESKRDAELSRMRRSPPPKFKFLRDAEEKLLIQRRRIMEENGGVVDDDDDDDHSRKDEGNGQFIALNVVVGKNQEEGICKNDVCSNVDLEHECFSSRISSSSSSIFRETLQQQIQKPHV